MLSILLLLLLTVGGLSVLRLAVDLRLLSILLWLLAVRLLTVRLLTVWLLRLLVVGWRRCRGDDDLSGTLGVQSLRLHFCELAASALLGDGAEDCEENEEREEGPEDPAVLAPPVVAAVAVVVIVALAAVIVKAAVVADVGEVRAAHTRLI